MTQPLGSFPAFLNDVYANMASPAVLDDVAANPVGTGPFILENRGADAITFVRNQNYWDPDLPRSERFVFSIIPDTQAQIAALQTGDIDILQGSTDATDAQLAGIDGMQIVDGPGLGTLHVFLNTTAPPFDDVNARLALAHATDREAFVEFNHLDGSGEVVDGPFPSGMPITGSLRADWPAFDPAVAQEMVDELGGLSFTLLTYNVATYPQQAQLLQDMWKQSGIDMEINLQDVNTVIADAIERKHDALLSTWSGRADPDLNAYRYLHSESAATSPAGIEDDVLDGILTEARETVDNDTRRELYQQLNDRIAEIVPILYLEGLTTGTAARAEVGGIVQPPDSNIRPKYLFIES